MLVVLSAGDGASITPLRSLGDFSGSISRSSLRDLSASSPGFIYCLSQFGGGVGSAGLLGMGWFGYWLQRGGLAGHAHHRRVAWSVSCHGRRISLSNRVHAARRLRDDIMVRYVAVHTKARFCPRMIPWAVSDTPEPPERIEHRGSLLVLGSNLSGAQRRKAAAECYR